jgi:hypothetical protein
MGEGRTGGIVDTLLAMVGANGGIVRKNDQ